MGTTGSTLGLDRENYVVDNSQQTGRVEEVPVDPAAPPKQGEEIRIPKPIKYEVYLDSGEVLSIRAVDLEIYQRGERYIWYRFIDYCVETLGTRTVALIPVEGVKKVITDKCSISKASTVAEIRRVKG